MRGWTELDIPEQRGKRAIVTGANRGIGYHTALQLARNGASVVLACRDTDSARAAAERIAEAAPDAAVAVGALDLADLASVRAFAAEHGEEPLDILVNNAGVMAIPRRTTADGFEMQFGTNHLGHFALTGLLMPALHRARAPRVVTVTSVVAWAGRLDFGDLQGERRYRKFAAYAQSKLANLIFARELERRFARVTGIAAHPGYASTDLLLTGPRMQGSTLREKITALGNAVFAQSAAAGALPSLYAATGVDAVGGACYAPRLLQYRGTPTEVVTPPQANRAEQAARLWEVSEELTGVAYAAAPA